MRRVICFLIWGLIMVCLLVLTSCATSGGFRLRDAEKLSTRGVWHKVEEGQTLWRIAKTYRVPIEVLKEANDIQDVVHISVGTWLFIPGAEKVLFVQGNLDNLPEKQSSFSFVWPVKGEIIRHFGKINNDFNYGIDIKTKMGSEIVSAQKGVVVVSGVIRGYGKTVIIEHPNDFCSLYSRNLMILVREGQKVDTNTIIARVSPEAEKENDIVHYELFYRGKPVNPLYYLP